jgi:hypothetical protein
MSNFNVYISPETEKETKDELDNSDIIETDPEDPDQNEEETNKDKQGEDKQGEGAWTDQEDMGREERGGGSRRKGWGGEIMNHQITPATTTLSPMTPEESPRGPRTMSTTTTTPSSRITLAAAKLSDPHKKCSETEDGGRNATESVKVHDLYRVL